LGDRHVGAKGPGPLEGQADDAPWRYADPVSQSEADADANQGDYRVGDEATPGDGGGRK
jgi:hypothetical protein